MQQYSLKCCGEVFLESFDLSMDAQSRSRLETHQLHHHLRIQGEEALSIHLLGGGEGEREGGRERGREGGREGRREGGKERGREGRREGGREGEREGGREGRKEGGRERVSERVREGGSK